MNKYDEALLQELRDEADLCGNDGVAELAELLNAAADRIAQLTAPKPLRIVTYVCPVCAASLERQE